ncbi:MAG: hypothetical protein IJO09_10240 [Oscillospiraceae bacterium]|nr:hypothetical protein [Oscillospiraceae bacterium]
MKKFLKKATSLVVAFAIVAAFIPVSGLNASAAEVGDTVTFGMSYGTYYKTYEDTESAAFYNADVATLLGEYYESDTYCRNWRVFAQSWDREIDWCGYTGGNGLFYRDAKSYGSWFALKVKGFGAGKYDISAVNYPQRGCVWGLYVLDNSIYGNADADTITNAITNYATTSGVQKIGEVDTYGAVSQGTVDATDSTTPAKTNKGSWVVSNFGEAAFVGDPETEHILVFRAEREGTLEEGDTAPSQGKSEKYISLFGLTFTYTGGLPAQNEENFGSSAAFFEKTENGDCNVYLVSAIDSLDYINAGFKVAVDGGASETIMTETVYQKITVDGEEYDATDFGLSDGYLFVAKKTLAAFTGQDIDFKPFATAASGEVAGSTYCATLSGGNE